MENEVVSRGKFLKDLGLSGAALMAFYCMGTVTSCSKSSSDPTPTTGTTGTSTTTTSTNTSTNVDFTLDLTTNDFSLLKTKGNFTYKDNVIIINSGGSFIALSKVCTHEGYTVDYRSSNNDIHCANHGSLYNIDGTNKQGPAVKPLTVYKTDLSTDGNKLRIYQ